MGSRLLLYCCFHVPMRFQHWKDKTDALKRRLEHLRNMNASDFGRDKRVESMESMIERLKARVQAEQVRSTE